MQTVGELGEFGLIDRLTKLLPTSALVVEGIGDDCAVLRMHDRLLLVSTDLCLEDIHFRRDTLAPGQIGWKAAAASLSDIAAMGSIPLFSLVSLACPGNVKVSYIEELYRGMSNALSSFGAIIVGGDTTRSEQKIVIDVMIIGEPLGNRFLRRRGAIPGDLLAITGSTGASAAGLHAIQHGHAEPALVHAHATPHPRIAEGQWLCARPAIHAMIDISDGLAQDARHIANASGLGVNIAAARLPLIDPLAQYCAENRLDPLPFMLSGGEDYELAFALSPSDANETMNAFASEFTTPVTIVGEFTDEWTGGRLDGAPSLLTGFDHFKTPSCPD